MEALEADSLLERKRKLQEKREMSAQIMEPGHFQNAIRSHLRYYEDRRQSLVDEKDQQREAYI